MSETHVFTLTARPDFDAIARFIGRDNPPKAREYFQSARTGFLALDDSFTPRRASPNLPEAIREMPVKGFRGYSLRVMKEA